MRKVEAEQAADHDAMRMTFDDLLDLAFDGRKRMPEQRYAGIARRPLDAFEGLSALQAAVVEAVRKLVLVRAQDVDPEHPMTLDQCEAGCLPVDADQEAGRGGAERGQRGDRRPRNIVATAGGDDADAAGQAAHDRAELAFDFVACSDEMKVGLAHSP